MENSVLNVNIPSSSACSYPIIIKGGCILSADEIIPSYVEYSKAVVITNTKVDALYSAKFNLNAEKIVIDDGEQFKSFETYKKIIDKMVELNIQRSDVVVALGGGVVGDIAGFAAATYMRGIKFVQVPTTLLAQVDSSVGGKVAINLEQGKNLVGAFYQPQLVLSDTEVLKTLDERELKSGLGEVVKYAFIEKTCGSKTHYEQSLFDFLYQNAERILNLDDAVLPEMIRRCCELKAAVVNADEKEKGLRAILNFGHTFAHAVEKCTNYTQVTHGEAVAAGMEMALELSKKLNLISNELFDESLNLIKKFGLDFDFSRLSKVTLEEFLSSVKHDKKSEQNYTKFILANGRGECVIENISNYDLIREIVVKYVGK